MEDPEGQLIINFVLTGILIFTCLSFIFVILYYYFASNPNIWTAVVIFVMSFLCIALISRQFNFWWKQRYGHFFIQFHNPYSLTIHQIYSGFPI